jgi:hypothetical protein
MNDIVQRLRAWSPLIASGLEVPAASLAAEEAAAEITRLRARVEMLEGLAHQSLTVLQCSDDHSEHWCAHCDDNIGGSHIVALRAALEAKP